jgi:A/G-specific adenine glycosylase
MVHKTAKYVATELSGYFRAYIDLLKLKVLANILLLQLHLFIMKQFLYCGNVFRVLSRYFDVETDIAQASAKGNSLLGFRSHAKDNLPFFNQAIIWSSLL